MATTKLKSVAIIANSSWNVVNFRKTLIQFLKDEGIQIFIFAPVDEYTARIQQDPSIQFVPLNYLKAKTLNPVFDLLFFFELLTIFRRIKVDLILPHTIKPNIYASLVARLIRLPCVSSLTGLGSVFIKSGWFYKMLQSFYQWALSGNKYILFHNKVDQMEWLDQSGSNETKTMVIPGSGIDTHYFKPSPEFTTQELPVFLFLGRLHPEKGIYEFLDAAQMMNSKKDACSFWISGEYELDHRALLERIQNSPWIRYLGMQADVRKVLEQVSVVVLPSYREGMPRALMEAMAMGKPVIACNVAGCNELISHRVEGLLASPQNAQSIVSCMEELLQYSNQQRALMGLAGRRKVETYFSESRVTQAYKKLFAALNQTL